jgi:hypothetical protein
MSTFMVEGARDAQLLNQMGLSAYTPGPAALFVLAARQTRDFAIWECGDCRTVYYHADSGHCPYCGGAEIMALSVHELVYETLLLNDDQRQAAAELLNRHIQAELLAGSTLIPIAKRA